MKKKTKSGMKMIYRYIEPNTKEEKEEWERRINKAYELLFEATIKNDILTR